MRDDQVGAMRAVERSPGGAVPLASTRQHLPVGILDLDRRVVDQQASIEGDAAVEIAVEPRAQRCQVGAFALVGVLAQRRGGLHTLS